MALDLDMLAYDIADAIQRNGHDLDVAASHIRPALPDFINRIKLNAQADDEQP